MSGLRIFFVTLFVILIIAFFVWQIRGYKVPEPPYTVIKKENTIELRQYPALLIAQVMTDGDRNTAIRKGFRKLADFIFGKNHNHQKIAMTAPVMQTSAKTPITASVNQQQDSDNWFIRFVMPSSYTLENLPKPVSNDIKILESPAKRYLVIQFSGGSGPQNLKEHETLLRDYIEKNNLRTVGPLIYAFYNPPWILPFLRRNEIMLETK